MIDVNLLPEQTVVAKGDVKARNYAILAVVICSVITILGLGGVFGYRAYQSMELARLEREKAELNATLDGLTPVASKFLTLKKKAMGIKTIEKYQYDFADAFGYVSSLVPSDVNLNQVAIKNTGEVTLGLTSTQVPVVVGYITSVSDDPALGESRVTNFGLNDSGEVIFSLGSKYGESKTISVDQ